jgi:hypothetical protein
MRRRLTPTLTIHFHTPNALLHCDSHVSLLGCVYYALVNALMSNTGV